jgi:hydroxypyruvate reductase
MAQPTPRAAAIRIFHAALKAADPYEAVMRHVRVKDGFLTAGRRQYSLKSFEKIHVIGAGKASARMAQAIERLLGRRVSHGLINVKYGHTAPLRWIELNECAHPVPDESGLRGAERILEIASEAGSDDLVICLISGGASALLPCPLPPMTLEEKQQLTGELLRCGANIHELNTVRKHISRIKGGRLAVAASPAQVLALILSDVIGDDLDVIGSGPTVPDRSTMADAERILRHYGITTPVLGESPKPEDAAFRRVQNLIVGSNALAVSAAADEARRLGYCTMMLSTYIEGETRDVARVHAAIAKEVVASGRPVRSPACVISGGETTVTVRGTGLGGRNQEFALAAALDIAGFKEVVVFSGGTDGSDGPTDAAGAIADGGTIERGRLLGLDARAYLENNDSYRFFEKLGDLVKTGPTGTNVADVRLVLVTSPAI